MQMSLLLWVLLPLCMAPCVFLPMFNTTKKSLVFQLSVCAITFLGLLTVCISAFKGNVISLALPDVLGLGLYFEASGFRALYALIASIMWLVVAIFCFDYFKYNQKASRFVLFTLIILGAVVGLFLSNNLYTLFIFFEVMSLSSYAWVIQEKNETDKKAGDTYLFVSVAGGMTMLMGMFLLPNGLATASFAELSTLAHGQNLFLPACLLLVGFGAKVGLFPLHVWLPLAYPISPAPATALLSGLLTKAGVFGCILLACSLMHGNMAFSNLLFVLGVITMVLGAVLGVISNDLKRTLAYSSLSQMGFIMQGVALSGLLTHHNGLAVFGTVGHMINHSLFKLILFLCAGVVMMHTNASQLEDVKGFGRKKPVFHFCFLLSVLGISGIPLFSGYISKSLIHEAMVEWIHLCQEQGLSVMSYQFAEALFLISGGLTLCYMLKLYICLFHQKNKTNQAKFEAIKKPMSLATSITLGLCSLLVVVIGVFPDLVVTNLGTLSLPFFHGEMPHHMPIPYYGMANLQGAAISISVGLVVFTSLFFILKKKSKDGKYWQINQWPLRYNMETCFYRPIILAIIEVLGFIANVLDRLVNFVVRVFYTVSSAITVLLNGSLEEVFLFGKKTAFAPAKGKKKPEIGTRFTYAFGSFIDKIIEFLNKTIYKKNPIQKHFVSVFAAGRDEITTDFRAVTKSISFGLLLFCLGLFVTLIYLLFH